MMKLFARFGEVNTIHGNDGDSAYQIAVKNGFEGTEEEWLESLKGEPGRSANSLYVEISQEETKDDHGKSVITISCNRTYAELKEAIDKRYIVYGQFKNKKYGHGWQTYDLITNGASNNGVSFGTLEVHPHDTINYEDFYIFIDADDKIRAAANDRRYPNPQSLTIEMEGQEEINYSGSKNVWIKIPSKTTSLPWEAITNKPFGEITGLLDMSGTVDPENVALPITQKLELEVGKTYTVTWNGVEYESTAVEFTVDGGESMTVVGNLVGLGGENTGEPFLIAIAPEGADVTEGYGVVLPLDGSVTITLNIREAGTDATSTIKTLDPKYIPESAHYMTDVVTGKQYKLLVVNGELTMEEVAK